MGTNPGIIMIVEDNEVNQDILGRMLSRLGYESRIFGGAPAALSAIKEENFLLVFMDCQMPIMSGYDATREIRKIEAGRSHIPIIAVTSDAEHQKALDSGMDDYLPKPLQISLLKSMLEKWVNGSVNTAALTDLMDGSDTASLKGLVEKFRINTEKLFGEMQAELKKNNADGVRLVGHTLKGSSRSMGATRLGDLWEQMEKMAVKNELSEIPALADEIKNEIGKTFASFERFLSTDKAA